MFGMLAGLRNPPFDSGEAFMPKLDDYMQIAEAAEYLGVCHNTLRNWGKQGRIKEYRHPVNNYRLYSRLELDQLFESVGPSLALPESEASQPRSKNKGKLPR